MWKQSAKRWASNTIRKLCYDCSDVEDYIQVIENSRQPINRDAKIIISSYDLVSKNIKNRQGIKDKVSSTFNAKFKTCHST